MTARAGGAASRQRIRRARRALPPAERERADASIRSHLIRQPAFRAARAIAMFFGFDGEPDLSPLLRSAQAKQLFVPVIRGRDMRFAAIDKDSRLSPNQFGILEPETWSFIDPRSLDLVLTPLVAFDGNGNRLGVGGGFYDRCFAFLKNRRHWHRPKLLGIAYTLQEIEPYEPNPWDVPLWGVLTERGYSGFACRR